MDSIAAVPLMPVLPTVVVWYQAASRRVVDEMPKQRGEPRYVVVAVSNQNLHQRVCHIAADESILV